MSGILKRKFEDVDASSPCSSARESDDEVSSSESADSGDSVNPSTSNHFTREYWNPPVSRLDSQVLREGVGGSNHHVALVIFIFTFMARCVFLNFYNQPNRRTE
jgi:hypothetical protein